MGQLCVQCRDRERWQPRARKCLPCLFGNTAAAKRRRAENYLSVAVRRAVTARDRGCRYCGIAGDRNNPLEFDHVLPLIAGGKSTVDNVVRACQRCNRRKRNRGAP